MGTGLGSGRGRWYQGGGGLMTVAGWPRSVGLWDLSVSRGAPVPCGPTRWLRGVPRSHDQSPRGKASRLHLGLCFCSWQTESPASWKLPVLGFKKQMAASGGPRSRCQGPQRCPAARANRESTHRPQNPGDKLRGTKCVTGKSPPSPGQKDGAGMSPGKPDAKGLLQLQWERPPGPLNTQLHPQGCNPNPLSHQSPAPG